MIPPSLQRRRLLLMLPERLLKLKSPRAKDRADVIELIKAGADVEKTRAFLEANARDLVAELERAVVAARQEEE
ncbi:MAG: hypothetical protein IT380_21675 [Myxococcales bacterium]|nr:hypothetical protein [Myxococcales bacterium]